MKLFGFEFSNTSKKQESSKKENQKVPFEQKGGKFPVITEADKEWVEENFNWLMGACGLPKEGSKNILFSKEFFPESFSSESLEIPNLIADFSDLLNLEVAIIDFELQKDITDIYGMPYAHDDMGSSQIEITENGYILHIPNEIVKRPNQLLFSVLKGFIKIRLLESHLSYDTGHEDYDDLFIHLVGIYFGFGVIFLQNLIGGGYSTDGIWETKWSYTSIMPKEVMTYSLALYCGLIEEENFEWKENLHPSIKLQFEKAMEFLAKYPSSLFNPTELKAMRLIEKSYQEYEKNKFEFSISISKESLTLTNDSITQIDIYNNIGYFQLRNGNLQESISSFEKALEIEPTFGVASDNLAYVYVKLGQLEKAKHYLEEAIATENNELAYHYRNVALYYAAKGKNEEAEEYFDMAFREAELPVDLLEFDYALFLFNQNKEEEAMNYLKLAIEKNEPEAINKMKDLNNLS
ncbi:tetratricopeptide repeat protein [Bernardetia sp. ABR2-2B]|uniref:tetratricopeptide repeat protein n=1 Tax=Bernardetia sp. ABR2-2B TaxID=3127472 RepID=UPI0030CFA99E